MSPLRVGATKRPQLSYSDTSKSSRAGTARIHAFGDCRWAVVELGSPVRKVGVVHAVNGCYTPDWGKLGMTSDDFAYNQWFLPGCFGLTSSRTNFTAWCNGDNGKKQAKGIYLKLTHDGEVEACTLAGIIAAEPTYVP